MKFLFSRSRSTRQLNRSLRSLVSYRIKHPKKIPYLPAPMYYSHYLYWRCATFEISLHPVEAITILTVITFDDEVQRGPNADEQRKRLKEAAIEVTGSDIRNVFMIANSLQEQDLDPVYKKRVLKLMKKALMCGERSIKMRQTKRESPKKEIRHSESGAGELKYPTPVEHEYEPPTDDYKCKSLP